MHTTVERGTSDMEIKKLQAEIEAKQQELLKLRRELPGEPVMDYTFLTTAGEEIKLSELFKDSDELIIIHNMGKGCVYCTLWADGFNGLTKPLNDRAPFYVESPNTVEVMKEFAESRGWQFNMLSSSENTFKEDMGFKSGNQYMPGVSTFYRDKEGNIFRKGYDEFGPRDNYNAAWHLFDLLPKGINGWEPKYNY